MVAECGFRTMTRGFCTACVVLAAFPELLYGKFVMA
jgi:hypothetical protein